MTQRTIACILLAMLILAACGQESSRSPGQAGLEGAPPVFRSVLDGRTRMITLRLDDSLWVAYNAETGEFYRAWRDGVDLDGAVYTTVHGPQPESIGPAYVVADTTDSWHLIEEGREITPEVRYRGHQFDDDAAGLLTEIRTPDGGWIAVREIPRRVQDDDGHVGLERTFITENVPEGIEVAVDVELASLAGEDSYSTDGRLDIGGEAAETQAAETQAAETQAAETQSAETQAPGAQDAEVQGIQTRNSETQGIETQDSQTQNIQPQDPQALDIPTPASHFGSRGSSKALLTLNSNASTTFTIYFGEPAIARPRAGDGASKPEGLVLIERSDCAACHNPTEQTVGPSYLAIAERYEPSDLTITRLATKIIDGGSGQWGEAIMTPHPGLAMEDARAMVEYILSLGSAEVEGGDLMDVAGESYRLTDEYEGTEGLAVNVYAITADALTLDQLRTTEAPFHSGVVPAIHVPNEMDLGEVRQNVYVEATGYLNIQETDNYVIRVVSDDGSRLYLNGDLLIDNDGLHGNEARDAELILEQGAHPIRLEYFQGGGGGSVSLQWARSTDSAFSVIPPGAFTYEMGDLKEAVDYETAVGTAGRRPGDTIPLDGVHPSFAVETIRPDGFEPKVGGLDVLEDGRVVLSTWDPDGSVYVVSNVDAGEPDVKRIAWGLAEPLGLKVVDGHVYVMQKQELTRLVDTDGDEIIDRYETVANDWGATPNFHEFGFGLIYRGGYFYAALATAILPGGASADPQNPDRGTVLRIDRETGEVEIFARGLRTPNGLGFGVDGEIFLADNQGDWLPASKIVHIEQGDFHGSRSVDFGDIPQDWKRPVVWLPQDEIGNSPSQPAVLNVGPYENQLIHGEVTHGGIKRVFVEEVDGEYQGAVFRFTQGLEAGVNRIVWGPDGKLYIGGVGNPGNWGHVGKLMHGLQRMSYTGDPVFEMLAVRALPDGFEIEFTEPLADGVGEDPDAYEIRQWRYEPTAAYGGPKLDEETLEIGAVEVSGDRTRVRLTVGGMRPDHLVYIHLDDAAMRSAEGRSLWSTEAWYTLNRIPGATTAAAR